MADKKKTVKCTNKIAKTCAYSFSRGGESYGCDYIGKTGHMRGCSPEACDKYKKFEVKRDNGQLEDFESMYVD